MSVITEAPKDNVPLDKKGAFKWAWISWFQSVFLTCESVQESGPSTNRPTKNLWVGRRYFDTTLGYPIWWRSAGIWVDATGTPR
jgi:hypothetical protein